MKIFITGGTGFLGKHVQNKLSSKYDINAPSSLQLNILDEIKLINAIKDYNPDIILHMAASCGGILANKNSPADFLRDNTQMGLNIFEAARKTNVSHVYSLGSVCAYPKYCPIPFKEENIWNGAAEETNFPYGQAKRTLLMLGQTYRAQYGIGGAHFIPVNMYGEYDHFDLINSHVIPALIRKFMNAAEHDLPFVECWGTGGATREFLYAGDAATALEKAIDLKLNSDLPINLGIGQDISIKNLALLIKKLTNYNGEIIFTKEVSDGQPKRLLDVSRAKKMLDWTATTDFEEGLNKTINWYVSNKQLIID